MAEFSAFGAAGVDMRNIDFHLIYDADLAASGPGDYESEWLNFEDTVSYPEISYELRGWFVYSVGDLTLDVDFLSSSYVSFIRASWMETDDNLDFIEGLYEIRGFELNYTYFDGSMTSDSVAEIIFQYSDRIDGTWNDDYLMGYGGRDALFGDGGDDTLDGGTGVDVMLGGSGDDVYIIDAWGDVVWEYDNDGLDKVKSSVSYELSNNVERLILTGVEEADATGNTLANSLVGNVANNVLDGKSGADTMSGGKGNDTYIVDNVGDRVIETAPNGLDRIEASVSYSLAGTYVEDLFLTGTATINGIGNSLANTIKGNAGNNTINGGGGADKMAGGSGSDTATYETAATAVVASLYNRASNTGEAKGDIYSSIENLIGSRFSDRLEGNSAINILQGGAGNDRIYGGSGADKLYGGSGADIFVFKKISESTTATRDMIYDFSHSQGDKINLYAIDANTKISGNQAFSFIGEKVFSLKAGELRYGNASGDTYIYGDVNGDGKADFSVRLDKTIELVKGDFLL